ncbi:hypothetical protein DL93DRAFT_554088 [Clavulina sp. PMI_390]|nr:hypothetical protein DL93DRAFT_554088 [Clavulina sp. PMI_390]
MDSLRNGDSSLSMPDSCSTNACAPVLDVYVTNENGAGYGGGGGGGSKERRRGCGGRRLGGPDNGGEGCPYLQIPSRSTMRIRQPFSAFLLQDIRKISGLLTDCSRIVRYGSSGVHDP